MNKKPLPLYWILQWSYCKEKTWFLFWDIFFLTREGLVNFKKLWKHSPAAHVPTAFLILPNLHSCFYNLINTLQAFDTLNNSGACHSQLNKYIITHFSPFHNSVPSNGKHHVCREVHWDNICYSIQVSNH